MKKNTVPFFILIFFLVIYAFRLMDSFLIRTDQGPIGELFTHKLIGIALLAAVVFILRIKWADIGFKWNQLLRGILTGVAIGGSAFLVAYIVEITVAFAQGKSPSLQFFVTSYNTTGNTKLETGVVFILICVIGNIINVIMENGIFNGLFITTAEKRYSFAIANTFFSSFLFGLWHTVMPLRNYMDGNQSMTGAIFTALLYCVTSFIFSVQIGMQFKQAGSLWDGMTVHFINNACVNLLHVVFADGTESDPTMRNTIAQTMMFIIVWVRWVYWKRHLLKKAS
jgi:membrane protease YdiL (CAAX protease family)